MTLLSKKEERSRKIDFKQTWRERSMPLLMLELLRLGVSICLDRVSIETLDLEISKSQSRQFEKDISTVEKF
jgi:hypothetical protein